MPAPGPRRKSATPAPKFQVLLDFDGTLVEPNVAIELVGEFAPDGPRIAHEVDLELHAGKITLREAWAREVEILPMDRISEMREYTVRNVPLRKGAHELLDLLQEHGIPFAIVSGGLDFYIRPVLDREGVRAPIFCDTVVADEEGETPHLAHPYGHPTCRLCGICKARVVRDHAKDQVPVVFVGDGSTDRFAAEVADVVFARHRLLTYCRERGIPHLPFEDLHPVRETMARWIGGEEVIPRRGALGVRASKCPISQELSERSEEVRGRG
ncbi:MAG: HAD-IB family phosphatase [Euryarchaeota archaeon]|nr:HAD-IB family phosphatase [Euryarchaeota archaeon]MDE1837479.1 HAD-IB family phosphatase [Euryarchaeota archaeon]MDE1880565.1 HAD-IB family phosphatase [Euryarchaeota archaeon]MDE2045555.1 HAD-IB family phosphatase [Thermoplasmata archaeon]